MISKLHITRGEKKKQMKILLLWNLCVCRICLTIRPVIYVECRPPYCFFSLTVFNLHYSVRYYIVNAFWNAVFLTTWKQMWIEWILFELINWAHNLIYALTSSISCVTISDKSNHFVIDPNNNCCLHITRTALNTIVAFFKNSTRCAEMFSPYRIFDLQEHCAETSNILATINVHWLGDMT